MRELQRIAKERGVTFRVEEGGSHTIVWIGKKRQSVPRHREVDEWLARAIIRSVRL